MSLRVFLDTNIILDLLGKRDPFYKPAAKVATLADQKQFTLVVSALSFANVNYIITKFEGRDIALNKLRKFKVLAEVVALDEVIIDKSLNSDFSDFEDALQYYSALSAGCSVIITRNKKDFKASVIPVMSAAEYLTSINRD